MLLETSEHFLQRPCDHLTNEEVCCRIQNAIGVNPGEDGIITSLDPMAW